MQAISDHGLHKSALTANTIAQRHEEQMATVKCG
jgi:hypothetical protein